MNTTDLLNKLIQKQSITTGGTIMFVDQVIEGAVPPSQIGAILSAFRMKGETTDEILGFIQAMREHMVHIDGKGAIDVCGTGGDNSGTFNISTAVAFVVAGCGVAVAKHGNRAASSHSGSADVLEALGVNIQLSPAYAQKVLQDAGMVFLFAPLYHPAFKQVAMIRKELGIRTIFNVLGPFANPASVSRQLIGVPNYEIAEKLAEVGKKLSYTHLLIVTSEDGTDEISLSVKTHALEVKDDITREFVIDPSEYGFKKFAQREFSGGSAVQNASIIKQILSGEKGPKRDIVVLNSAYALSVAGRVEDISDGIKLAQETIDNGSAQQVLDNLVQETKRYAGTS